jgi:hypothetical protein
MVIGFVIGVKSKLVASPSTVITVIIVSKELGFDRSTEKTAILPSKTSGVLMETVGKESSSIIVPVPVLGAFGSTKQPEIIVPFIIIVSAGSEIVS